MGESGRVRSDTVPNANTLWTDPSLDHLGLAIFCTVAYADVFDYPLTTTQIQRYLVAMERDSNDILQALENGSWVRKRLALRGSYVTLPLRGELVDIRRRRAEVAAQLWPYAVRYGRAIASLPFVRSVALTGALAVGNVDPGDDFDFLIVTAADRLWLTRAMIIGLIVKPAARRGFEVCPNYLLSERKLDFEAQNLYVAHELAQMVPLTGLDIYRRIRAVNRWTTRFLPNADGPPRHVDKLAASPSSARALAEAALSTFVGERLERLERRRKIRRFTAQRRNAETVCFDVDHCKGHFESNEQTILAAFEERLQSLPDL